MTELKDKTKSLNQSGAFLQFHCLNELNKRQWQTIVETPVSVAPFDVHPEKHSLLYDKLLTEQKVDSGKFSQAVLESQNKAMKEETSVDIDAGKTIHIEFEDFDIHFRLFIEVKKNDPRYSDWCFFQQKIKSEPMRVIQKSIQPRGRVNLFTVTESDKYGNKIYVKTDQYHSLDIFKAEIADFALALQNKEVNREYFKSEKTKVDESARQIIKGSYGLIIEKIMNQVSTGNGYDGNTTVFVPIIVTNANLFLCKFDPKDIDSKSGHIKKDPEYEEVDKIIYEYPKPKEVQFPDVIGSDITAEFRDQVLKWHVLIMSPKGFAEFLDGIDKIKMIN